MKRGCSPSLQHQFLSCNRMQSAATSIGADRINTHVGPHPIGYTFDKQYWIAHFFEIIRFAGCIITDKFKSVIKMIDHYDPSRAKKPSATCRHYADGRSEGHTSELQSREKLGCRLLPEKKRQKDE